MKKVQWNSIDKKQNGLKYSKNNKSSTLPRGRIHEPSWEIFQFTGQFNKAIKILSSSETAWQV